MFGIVEEVRDICEQLSLERQKTLLKYAREAYAAENAGKKPIKYALGNETKVSSNISVRGK